MLSYIRALVVAACLLLFPAGLVAGQAEASPSSRISSASPAVSAPLLLGQYSGSSRSNYSSSQVRIPYGVIRLIVLGIMGLGGFLGSKMYR